MQKCFNAFSAAKHELVLQSTLNAQVAAKLQNCAKMLSKHGCCKAPKAGQVHLLQSRVLGAAKHPLVAQGNRQGVSPGSPWPVFFLLYRLTPMSVPPKYPDSDSSRTLVKFHPVWVRCWVRFSLAASVHRPIWVGAAFNGPSRHCLHGLLNLDSPGYDGMKPVSSESVLEGEKED